MTSAGVATAAFVAIVVVLYVAWSALAASEIWGRYSYDIIGPVSLFSWLCAHIIGALVGLALLLEWLGTVAGWWQQ